jgi:Metal-dependent hydrolases of the beta-lactamase superfamily III
MISGETAEQAMETEGDLWVHEATYHNSQAEMATEQLHSTAAGAARTAMEGKAKHPALTHNPARRDGPGPPGEEARQKHDSVTAGGDGDRMQQQEETSLIHMQKTTEGWKKLGKARIKGKSVAGQNKRGATIGVLAKAA